MDLAIRDVLGDIHNYPKSAEALVRDVLTERRSYDGYFVSQAVAGSIVEDIAETEAAIAGLERQLRERLVSRKGQLVAELRGSDVLQELAGISREIEQLWELDSGRAGKAADESVEAVEAPDEADDAFHASLRELRTQGRGGADEGLGVVLGNLGRVCGLLEVPALVSTCIRTGYYQEALMCHGYVRSLQHKFPGVELVGRIAAAVQTDISQTMLQGLSRLLTTNLTINAMKKITDYLASIDPFQDAPSALQQLFLSARFRFIANEIDSYAAAPDVSDAVREMLLKRKIECVREHVYGNLVVFNSRFVPDTRPIAIALFGAPAAPLPTSPLLLHFVDRCCSHLVQQLPAHMPFVAPDSVCLQLVYCSFRLADLNPNFHHLFMNALLASGAFSRAELDAALAKRLELVATY
ncbi:AaceriAER147Wp [[Ashbya] aceris (nom. inval.)]|nr:AaceriAER147Wp [[Ashbya] aceris (nom. inval.)]